MAGFNLNQLLDDPQFMMGASLLGNRSDDAMAQAIAAGQAMKRTQMMKADKESEREVEKARTELYRRQVTTAEENARRQASKDEWLQKAVSAFMPGQAAPQSVQGAPNAPQQPQLPQGSPSAYVPGSLAPGEIEPNATQRALQRAQGDVAALNRELARPLNPDQKMILTKELETANQKLTLLGGISQQQQQVAQATGNPFDQYSQGKAMAGAVRAMSGDVGGLSDLAESRKPNVVSPGQMIYGPNGPQQVPDKEADRKAQQWQQEFGLKQNENARQDQELELRRQDSGSQRIRAEADQAEAARKQNEADIKRNTQMGKEKSAFEIVGGASERAMASVDKLLSNPGLDKILGAKSYTNALAIRGGPAKEALNELEGIKSKLVNDNLQAIRDASANGASGYGSFTEKELEVVKGYIANLDPSGDPQEFKNKLGIVKKEMQNMADRAASRYESATGKSAYEGLPTGSRKVGTSGGKAVYRLPDGSMVQAQ